MYFQWEINIIFKNKISILIVNILKTFLYRMFLYMSIIYSEIFINIAQSVTKLCQKIEE